MKKLKIASQLACLILCAFGLYKVITCGTDMNQFAAGSITLFIGGISMIICSKNIEKQ